MARQYNGRNNGDLCAALTTLRPYGWKASETVLYAVKELRHYGFLLLTRQGGLNRPSLFALTWYPIHECGGKLDCEATRLASGDWKQPRDRFQRPYKKRNATTPSVADRYAIRISDAKSAASLLRHP